MFIQIVLEYFLVCVPCFRHINCCKDSKGLCVEIQKYLHVFCGDHGVLQFLYSILLTKVSECSSFSVFNIMEYDIFYNIFYMEIDDFSINSGYNKPCYKGILTV